MNQDALGRPFLLAVILFVFGLFFAGGILFQKLGLTVIGKGRDNAVLLFYLLAVKKIIAYKAAVYAFLVALGIAWLVFGMPATMVASSASAGHHTANSVNAIVPKGVSSGVAVAMMSPARTESPTLTSGSTTCSTPTSQSVPGWRRMIR